MASQRHALIAQWCEYKVHWEGESRESPVLYVSRKVGTRDWEPWVVVARSALLEEIGHRGLGLYAARRFRKGDVIGKYDGKIVGRYNSRANALRSERVRNLIEGGSDMIVTRSVRPRGVEVVNGSTSGAPYLQYANDPRGTSLRANAYLSPGGYLTVLQSDVPAFNLEKSMEDNIRSEIRWSYGEDYWNTFDLLGTKNLPIRL